MCFVASSATLTDMSATLRLALQDAPHGFMQQVTLDCCNVLRSSAAPQFIHALHALLELLANQLKILLRHPTHQPDSGCASVKYGFGVAGRAFSCLLRLLRFVSRKTERATKFGVRT